MSRESRVLQLPETRRARVEKRADGSPVIKGYAAVYFRAGDAGTEFELWPGAFERILPGAFDHAVETDVMGLFNHDSNQVLGRTPKTMRLSVDAIGLAYEIDPGNTTTAKDLLEHLERGDVSGSSFTFDLAGGVEKWRRDGEREIREIRRIGKLYDVGPVSFPAYLSTSSGAARRSFRSWSQTVAKANTNKRTTKQKRGANLAAKLNAAIEAVVAEDRPRETVVAELLEATAMEAAELDAILAGDETCPDEMDLELMAGVLDLDVEDLKAAATADGCTFEGTTTGSPTPESNSGRMGRAAMAALSDRLEAAEARLSMLEARLGERA